MEQHYHLGELQFETALSKKDDFLTLIIMIMKKTTLLLLIAPLMLFSCKKDHSAATKPAGKQYKVVFNVANFTQKQGSTFALRRQTNALAVDSLQNIGTYLDVLYYYVFDSNGYLLHRKAQDSTLCDAFGIINDSLKTGTYIIVMAAGKKGLTGTPGVPGVSTANSYVTYGSIDWQDTFFTEFQFTVAGDDVSQDVTLHRIVTKVELNVTDAIPSNANSITLGVWAEFPGYHFDYPDPDGLPDTLYSTVIIPPSAKGKPGFTFDKILGNQLALFNITITCRDAAGNIIAAAHVNDVQCDANKKTILSGNLFGGGTGPDSQTFQVKADTAWSNTTNQASFSLRRKNF